MVSLTDEIPKIIFGYYKSGVEPQIKCFNEVIGAVIIVVNADSISSLCSKPVITEVCVHPGDSRSNLRRLLQESGSILCFDALREIFLQIRQFRYKKGYHLHNSLPLYIRLTGNNAKAIFILTIVLTTPPDKYAAPIPSFTAYL